MGGNSRDGGGGSGVPDQIRPAKVARKEKITNFIKGGGITGAVIRGITDAAKGHNLKKRKEFVSKQNQSLPPSERIDLSDDYLSSAAGKKELTEKYGYNPNPSNNNQGGNDNNQVAENSIVQPKVESQMDNTGVKSKMIVADKTSPTTVEMSEDQRLIATKRKGRKTTMLTDIEEEQPAKLSKKVLLGA